MYCESVVVYCESVVVYCESVVVHCESVVVYCESVCVIFCSDKCCSVILQRTGKKLFNSALLLHTPHRSCLPYIRKEGLQPTISNCENTSVGKISQTLCNVIRNNFLSRSQLHGFQSYLASLVGSFFIVYIFLA